MRLLAKVLLLHASVALSSPVFEERALSPSACSKIEVIVALLKINGATPFCSSYLGIPAATTTVVKPLGATTLTTGTTTVTSYSNPIVTVTAFVTVPKTQINTATNAVITSSTVSTSTSIIVSTVTSFIYVQGAPAPARRELALERDSEERPAPVPRAAPTIPSQLKSFASAAISSGCLCLSIPTKTNTATQGVPATVKAQATATTLVESTVTAAQTDYVTQYTTITITTQPVTFITSVSTTTSTSIYTATVTVDPCQPPGLSFASGGNTGGGTSGTTFSVGSFQECCNACFYSTTKDCISYDYSSYQNYHSCSLTVSKSDEVDPALANAQCPLGQRKNTSVGGKMKNGNGFGIGPCLGVINIVY